MKHDEAMRAAILEAQKTEHDVPVGAVVVYEGKIIAACHNRREEDNAPFAHAEMLAMNEAAKVLGTRRLTGCTLYVTLEPCPMCAGAIVLSGLSKCYFGAYDRQSGCCGSVYYIPQDRHFNHQVMCVGGILEKECTRLLTDFFAQKRQGG